MAQPAPKPYLQPAHSISLQRYAELWAHMKGTNGNKEKQQAIVLAQGVKPEIWKAAAGVWQQRLMDPETQEELLRLVRPIYHQALEKLERQPSVSYEEFIKMCAAMEVVGVSKMLKHFQLSAKEWTEIAQEWARKEFRNQILFYADYEDRLRAAVETYRENPDLLAEPKPPSEPAPSKESKTPASAKPSSAKKESEPPPSVLPPPPRVPAQAGPASSVPFSGPVPSQPPHTPRGNSNNVPDYWAQLQNQSSTPPMFDEGAWVIVMWSDGQRHSGKVASQSERFVLVRFPNGTEHWVDKKWVHARA
jgi:hypothetical protein